METREYKILFKDGTSKSIYGEGVNDAYTKYGITSEEVSFWLPVNEVTELRIAWEGAENTLVEIREILKSRIMDNNTQHQKILRIIMDYKFEDEDQDDSAR